MPQSHQTSSCMEFLIEKAKEDLAQRLSISAKQISIIEANAVTWPDASLGCPQPGMVYAQLQTSGFRVILEAVEKKYEYHTDTSQHIVFCESVRTPNGVAVSTILSEEISLTPLVTS